MKKSTSFVLTAFGLAILLSGCESYVKDTEGTPASTTRGAEIPASAMGPNRVATGTQGDTLDACLARIPGNSTATQKMLAERTCQRDAENRKAIDLVPGQ